MSDMAELAQFMAWGNWCDSLLILLGRLMDGREVPKDELLEDLRGAENVFRVIRKGRQSVGSASFDGESLLGEQLYWALTREEVFQEDLKDLKQLADQLKQIKRSARATKKDTVTLNDLSAQRSESAGMREALEPLARVLHSQVHSLAPRRC